MKTIKAIVFGALIVTAIVTGFILVTLLCAVDTSDFWALVKMFLNSGFLFGASCLAIKYLYERWYRQ